MNICFHDFLQTPYFVQMLSLKTFYQVVRWSQARRPLPFSYQIFRNREFGLLWRHNSFRLFTHKCCSIIEVAGPLPAAETPAIFAGENCLSGLTSWGERVEQQRCFASLHVTKHRQSPKLNFRPFVRHRQWICARL